MPSCTETIDEVAHQPAWPDQAMLWRARHQLAALPRLVGEVECADLLAALARVARREALIVQAGDCAERFADATERAVAGRIDQLDRMARTLSGRTGLDTVRIGRIAGQYAKPRSAAVETLPDGSVVGSYLGDAVNDLASIGSRTPDPRRLLIAHHCADFTLRRLRESWAGRPPAERMYASHEALLLDYEEPLLVDRPGGRLASSGHLLWIGRRTNAVRGRHVALASSLVNPVGVKIGPETSPAEARQLSLGLNPLRVPGKVIFIARFGAGQVASGLPPVVAEVTRHGASVSWVCDPMHGNGFRLGGVKTRAVSDIKAELRGFVETLTRQGQWPAGVHLECAPDDVTECVADRLPGTGADFSRYRSACDPRLNRAQADDVIEFFATLL